MIVDTSALVAVLRRENGHAQILDALVTEISLIPAPVLVEFARVMAAEGNEPDPRAAAFIDALLGAQASILPFTAEAAAYAVQANPEQGRGKGRGGVLNILDLMVLGAARATGRPILCTGRDFAAAGAELHPASRPW